ncbi:MAG: DUF6879 family protein [Patescibacteria group bacterium]
MSGGIMQTLEEAFRTFQRYAFRLEMLGYYDVEEEREDYQCFLNGEAVSERKNEPWCSQVREFTAEHKDVSRIRILPAHLNPYIRYELEWGYPYSAEAGELIWLVPYTGYELVPDSISDFWLFDDEHVFAMQYDDGKYQGATLLPSSEMRKIRDVMRSLMEHATLFEDYNKRLRRGIDPLSKIQIRNMEDVSPLITAREVRQGWSAFVDPKSGTWCKALTSERLRRLSADKP